MSVCFAFQGSMCSLHGTRGRFPTVESIYFKARGPTVITILVVMKYYHCGEEGEEMITKNENQVHIGSSGKKSVINDAIPTY